MLPPDAMSVHEPPGRKRAAIGYRILENAMKKLFAPKEFWAAAVVFALSSTAANAATVKACCLPLFSAG
jgi:hypothetical protein